MAHCGNTPKQVKLVHRFFEGLCCDKGGSLFTAT